MAEIFVSYTHSDREWAFWIGEELEVLGHIPRLHDWEVPGGGDIMAWMEARHDEADRVLCVVSKAYLAKPYSSLERRAAQWAALAERPNFALPVFVEACKAPTLFAPLKRCDLYGIVEQDARARLKTFLETPGKRPGRTRFPGGDESFASQELQPVRAAKFPGKTTLSNIPIGVPRYFLGRDDALSAIDAALRRESGRVALTALHGLRGVGKTTLAAAYADLHRSRYRATWWIRAQEESNIKADLVALGIRLRWVDAYEKEATALAVVMERLRYEGKGILLIYDNAADVEALKLYLPRGGRSQTLITSTSSAWRGVAAPVQITVWPEDIGADYLIARTGREHERAAAKALSQTLGGLPLAIEQAAAYCERLAISLQSYHERFMATPTRLLDSNALPEYHDGLTVARTFGLAIEEAQKLHPAAQSLIVYAALLAPEPIPLFLFAGIRKRFDSSFATSIADGGLDEAVAALSSYALIERETVVDERDPAISMDTIRLHRLVRLIAAEREVELLDCRRAVLLDALASVYPDNISTASSTWPKARRLDAIAIALTEPGKLPRTPDWWAPNMLDRLGKTRTLVVWLVQRTKMLDALKSSNAKYNANIPYHRRLLEWLLTPKRELGTLWRIFNLNIALIFADQRASTLLAGLAQYRRRVLEDLHQARHLFERALELQERSLGLEHRGTAAMLHALGTVLLAMDDVAGAKKCHERAIEIFDKQLGPDNPETGANLEGLASILERQGLLVEARVLSERALQIAEKTHGPEDVRTGTRIHNLALLVRKTGNLDEARALLERGLSISERALGPDNVETATSLHSLALLLEEQGDLVNAQRLAERALAIRERAFGTEHSETASALTLLANILLDRGDLIRSRSLANRARAVRDRLSRPQSSRDTL